MAEKNVGMVRLSVKKLNRSAVRGETRPNRLKLLVSILNRGDDETMSGILNDFSVAASFSCIGTGTAHSAVLNYLGIGTSSKSVMFSLIPESDEELILDGIRDKMSLYLVGRGISFTVPLSAVSELVSKMSAAAAAKTVDGRKIMNDGERKYDLIVSVVSAGFVDEAMEAARAAGAAGGTIIRSRSVSNAKAEQFIGISLQEETEILMILAKRTEKAAIMNALNEKVGLKTEARAVLFSLPVDRTVGVGAAPDENAVSDAAAENNDEES